MHRSLGSKYSSGIFSGSLSISSSSVGSPSTVADLGFPRLVRRQPIICSTIPKICWIMKKNRPGEAVRCAPAPQVRQCTCLVSYNCNLFFSPLYHCSLNVGPTTSLNLVKTHTKIFCTFRAPLFEL